MDYPIFIPIDNIVNDKELIDKYYLLESQYNTINTALETIATVAKKAENGLSLSAGLVYIYNKVTSNNKNISYYRNLIEAIVKDTAYIEVNKIIANNAKLGFKASKLYEAGMRGEELIKALEL